MWLKALLTSGIICCVLPQRTLGGGSVAEMNAFIEKRDYVVNGVNYTMNDHYFPSNFMFGFATAAYQHEGAWNEDGKSENIWDRDVHFFPEHVVDRTNGDIASDMYHTYPQDIQLMKDMGAKAYRFSIAWTRILPNGYKDYVNQAGIDYYKRLIAEVKAAGMEPLPTMYHWDLPQVLQDQGGWINQTIVGLFVDYADVLFENFGDDITYWVTHNEPQQTCEKGYGIGGVPPNIASSGLQSYTCAHHLLLSHGETYQLYRQKYYDRQKGKISMVIDTDWYEPASNSAQDLEASERGLLFTYGWFAHPIFFGDYPEVMKTRIEERSLKEGLAHSRLPEFTDSMKKIMKGTADYLCINMYTSILTKWVEDAPISKPSRGLDMGIALSNPSSWEGYDDWKIYPAGARKLITWLHNTYGSPEILITESGWWHEQSIIDDLDSRGYYHKLYLSNILDSMVYDGANVIGYMAWSILDCYNWYMGYTQGTSFYYVDFNDPALPRKARTSAPYYRHVCNRRCLVDSCN
ncbi:myrosinase 1-like [Cylas formicarius]|uniref:myrosinase 1-like n=1 Tax=Cylas formicarius TaxID=197179 RepID=UPI0029583CDB|nr:myrosinase 1-like [Cylas formicarius]